MPRGPAARPGVSLPRSLALLGLFHRRPPTLSTDDVIGSAQHRIVYVRVPKTGSSSVKLWMKPALRCRSLATDDVHSPWVPENWSDCDVFVTIREPLSRAASYWHWCRSIYPERFEGWEFERFFDWLAGTTLEYDLLSTPPCEQMWFIERAGASYRHRMEELDSLPSSWRFASIKGLPAMRREHVARYEAPVWTAANVERVRRVWPRDFDLLGY